MIPATTDPLRPPTPYPGLRPFLEEDAWRFFGRGEQTSRMLECLETRRFLAVVGASGCGKSSLVYAGLLPALKEGWLNGGLPNWKMVTLRLGEAPLHNLATALHQKLSPDPTATDPYALPVLRNTLEEGRFGLLRAIENAQIGDETNVLVFVDQFEELFRYRERAEQEQRAAGSTQSRYDRANESIAFVNLLLTAAQQTRQPVYVMLSMRSDFLGNCDLFQGLPELISQSQFLTPRMTRDQLREAIVEPLKLFQAKFEPGLVDRILNEVGTEHDQLPLMQHALMRTWNIACPKADAWKTESIVVSAKHYLHPKVQGVAHALDLHAEEVYQRFADRPDPAPTAPAVNQTGPLAQYDFVQWFRSQFRPNATPVVSRRQEFCERLFRSLCDTNNSGQLVRRLVKIEQIAAEADPAVDNADPQLAQAARERVIQEIIAVAQPFLAPDCSLLNASPTVSDTQPLTGETTLDISHEALLRQWGHCKTWVATERDSARKWRRVVEQATLARDGRAAHFSRADLVPLEQWRKEQKPTQAWTRRYAATVDSPVDFETAEKFLQASGIRAIALSVVLFLLPLVVVGLSGWLYWSKQKAAADKVIAEQVEEKRKADDKRNSDENQYITARVTKLLGANEPSQIAETLEELKGKDSKWQTELHAKLPKSLVELARTLPESRKRKQLNAALALVSLAPAGESLDVAIQCIVDEILRPGTTPQQITLLRDFLTPYADQAEPKLWPWVKPEANRVQRLRAAAALAGIPSAETALPATATGKWKELGTDIVRELLSVSPLELKAWTDTLGPRREFLEKELTTIYYESRGKENRRAQREAAALVLAEAWSDVPEKIIGDTEEKLIGWLADADSPAEFLQFATVLKNKLDDRRINLLVAAAGGPHFAELPLEKRNEKISETYWRDQWRPHLNAAACQVRLGKIDQIHTLLLPAEKPGIVGETPTPGTPEANAPQVPEASDQADGGSRAPGTPEPAAAPPAPADNAPANKSTKFTICDPTFQSYLRMRIQELDAIGDANDLSRFWSQKPTDDPAIQQIMLLALGDFDSLRLPDTNRKNILDRLAEVYSTSPDSGVRSAARWTWNQWQRQRPENEVDDIRMGDQPGLQSGNWFVNKQGQTYAILRDNKAYVREVRNFSRDFQTEKVEKLIPKPAIPYSFAMATHEVTIGSIKTFLEDKENSKFRLSDADRESLSMRVQSRDDNLPIAGVSWYAAAVYCNWLSNKDGIYEDQWCYKPLETAGSDSTKVYVYDEGMQIVANFREKRGYRLPTEEEWEYACRAGSSTQFSFGEPRDEKLVSSFAWWGANSEPMPHLVGTKRPNRFGLFDMHGNLWEWTNLRFENPDLGTDAEIVDNQSGRVLRGGSFDFVVAGGLGSSYRVDGPPGYQFGGFGFRPSRTYP